jgi:hypothetical protein
MAILGIQAVRDSSTARPSGAKSGPTKLHSAATLRTPQTLKEEFWLEKCDRTCE